MGWGRTYFAVQAIAGAAWWVAVFVSPFVREATLGRLDPVIVAVFDLPLFVGASALAALGLRPAAIVSTVWTILVAVALAVYTTVTTEAGWGVLLMAAAAFGSVVALCLMLFGRVPTGWIIAGPFAFRTADANRLVVAGPYRFVRNPMAMAGIVQGAAVGLILSSWLVIAYAVAGSLL